MSTLIVKLTRMHIIQAHLSYVSTCFSIVFSRLSRNAWICYHYMIVLLLMNASQKLTKTNLTNILSFHGPTRQEEWIRKCDEKLGMLC